jgi:hypothetical protein
MTPAAVDVLPELDRPRLGLGAIAADLEAAEQPAPRWTSCPSSTGRTGQSCQEAAAYRSPARPPRQ